ncbi:hydroxysqualene dehydroxylase HpnE [Methylibium petroleiphilum]|uniref:Putative squalene/phytoene dehydrogenase n=2 Tax=Methylibium TaxID=316612 RepID=A2SFA9_METPP|nr:hydroxysqualene dehydroxylase HpnE [Methylibium petroleiphilum]ABM94248.1 putative squalene/phytoene dehydrogenase [Methylibium petroleiphilum PM1]
MTSALRVAIVGGGWAGLAAAVEASALGHQVTLAEMAPSLGGRARRLPASVDGLALDNGQHILIGAYSATLSLLRTVGVDERTVLQRRPLTLIDAQGHGLSLPRGPALPGFVRGVLSARGWSLRERMALLCTTGGWLLRGFRCDERLTVADLTASLPATLRRALIEPLCVAALNTPAQQASAQVFLRVLRDALFAGPGASDLLLPRVDLGALWPDAAATWLRTRDAVLHTGRRVNAIAPDTGGWQVDGERFDRVVLACSAVEAARLAAPHAPAWAELAAALRYEPIVTVLLHASGARLPAPMLALDARDAVSPAQYVFDLGQLRDPAREPGATGTLAFVISGAADAVVRGLDATAEAVRLQATAQLGRCLPSEPRLLRVLSEKRATFLCTPGLRRPGGSIAPGLLAAGDYIDGPYPATLEGAMRAGQAAAQALPPTKLPHEPPASRSGP